MAGARARVSFDDSLPTYVNGGRRAELFAHFRSGVIVRAGRGRERAYPGLRGAAPPTGVFYSVLCQRTPGGRALDVGSGAGEGTRQLTTHFDSVTACDASGEAVAFARELAPLAAHVHVDACVELPSEPVDAAIVSDVLGHLQVPERLLWNLGASLRGSAQVLVAEPLAGPLQRLIAPARRGYSLKALSALLTRGGLRITEWITTRGTFVACAAVRDESPASMDLVLGLRALDGGDSDAALTCLGRAAAAGPREVAREAHYARAAVLLDIGRGDPAVEALLAAARVDGEDARPLAALAEVALSTGDAAGALRLGLDAVRLDPSEPAAASVTARAAHAVGHADAVPAWRIAVSLSPDDFELVEPFAKLCAVRGDAASGIAALERLRAYSDPLDARFHTSLAWLLLAEGRPADAELELKLARACGAAEGEVAELQGALRSSGVRLASSREA